MRPPGGGAASASTTAAHSELLLTRLSNNLACGNVLFNSGGLAIVGAGNTAAKTVNTVDYIVKGVYCTKAAATMAALAGTITQNNFGGWVFTIDASGTLASRFINQGATLAAITFPDIPPTETVLGWVRLNPTAASFVGGTTALDAASTNAVYVNAVLGIGFLVTVT